MKHFLILIAAFTVLIACTSEKPKENPLGHSPAGEQSSLPWLFKGPSGRVWLSWVEQVDSIYKFRFSEAGPEGWSTPATIAQSSDWFVNWADYPMLVTNDSGNFMAHVLDKSGPGKFSYDIRVFTSSDNGKSWNNSFLLNDDGLEAEHGFVSMTPWNGNVFFTWLDGRQTVNSGPGEGSHDGHHGSMSLRGAVRTWSGAKISEWQIDERTCDCCQTTAAIFNDAPLVVYRDRSETEVRDMAVSRLESGTWSAPAPVRNDSWQVKGCPVNGPRVAVSGDNLATVWFTSANDQPAVYAAISKDGGRTFGEGIRIDEGHANGRVDITSAGDDFIISWLEGEEIWIKKLSNDGTAGKSIVIAKTSSSRPSGFPQITMLNAEEVIVAWTDVKNKNVRTGVVRIE
jgi:hypothetical protein